ncbi:hypothetical protein BLA29_008131, partial [Euroglyphus maynei]
MFMIPRNHHRHHKRPCKSIRTSAKRFNNQQFIIIIITLNIFCLSTSSLLLSSSPSLVVQRHSTSAFSYDDSGGGNSTICPSYFHNDNITLNPCHCYGSIKMGIFVECTDANIRQINQTFEHLRSQSQSKAVHSL